VAKIENDFVKSNSSAVNDLVACDGCGMHPIVGPRYKCCVCKNFDFCAKCEEIRDHPHAFLKINDPHTKVDAIVTEIEGSSSEDELDIEIPLSDEVPIVEVPIV
jgi:hypothetical protein